MLNRPPGYVAAVASTLTPGTVRFGWRPSREDIAELLPVNLNLEEHAWMDHDYLRLLVVGAVLGGWFEREEPLDLRAPDATVALSALVTDVYAGSPCSAS